MISQRSKERVKDFLHRYRRHIVAGCIIFLAAVGRVIFSGSTASPTSPLMPSISPEISRGQNNANVRPSPVITLDNQVLFKAGQETIYQNDLRLEEVYYPFSNQDSKALLTKKLIDDSVILQGGAREGYISLDSSIFNGKQKEYSKRLEAVKVVKQQVEKKINGIVGTVITIWFLNDYIGPLGYEKAKEVAYQKITVLHTLVKTKQITIDEAAERIKQDTSLAQLDSQYVGNAEYRFRVTASQKISWEPSFDAALWRLPVGGITDIFLGTSRDLNTGGKIVGAYYMFGQITDKITDGLPSFEAWLNAKKSEYGVIYE